MKPKTLQNHGDVLENIAAEMDIPEHLDELARKRFKSIGNWLDRDESTIKQFRPEVFPQGSFLLGTVIRPIGDADEFDVDLVCKLNVATKEEFSMAQLKEAVGVEVKGYAKANSMQKAPEDKRRCWTLEYSDEANFHMDILPSLPDGEGYRLLVESSGYASLADNPEIWARAIAITDKTHLQYSVLCHEWPGSNPQGYAVWFHSRQIEAAAVRRHAVFEASAGVYAKVEDIPDHKVKTPLQRSIQLLKRHRDATCGNDEDKPISIIITTLAAHAYSGEGTVDEAIGVILTNMASHIEDKNGVFWVTNPVYPTENFADKWQETPAKAEKFYAWLDKACHDFKNYATGPYSRIPADLQEALSNKTLGRVLPLIPAVAAPAILSSVDVAVAEAARVIESGGGTKPWSR